MPKSKTNYTEIDDIREDLDSLRSNVVELTKHIKKDGSTHTKELQHLAQTRWEDFKESGQRQYKTLERQVKAKPAQALAIAFATGMFASLLMSGRRS